MNDSTTYREGSAELQENIEDVPGTKKWGTRQHQFDDDEFSREPERDIERVSPQEFYEEAERAKADFVQASLGQTPEPTGDEQVPPEQAEAQRKIAQERRGGRS